ncbi:MAG: hypothetical protein AAF413_03375 [Patescibacteria group bacterium]
MSKDFCPYALQQAFRKAEMEIYRDGAEWLQDPSKIPVTSIAGPDLLGRVSNPYYNLSSWLTTDAVERTKHVAANVDYFGIAQEHGLEGPRAETAIAQAGANVLQSYGPGFRSMANIFQVIPYVAAREGVSDRLVWSDISWQARNLGVRLTAYNTKLQANFDTVHVDESIADNRDSFRMDPGFFKLDQKYGITTVNPLDQVIKMVIERSNYYHPQRTERYTCPALDVGGASERSLFDDYWRVMVVAAREYIHPGVVISDEIRGPYGIDMDECYERIDTILDAKQAAESSRILPGMLAEMLSRMLDGRSIEGALEAFGIPTLDELDL